MDGAECHPECQDRTKQDQSDSQFKFVRGHHQIVFGSQGQISLTMDTYTHVMPAVQAEAAEAMDRVFRQVEQPYRDE